MVRSKILMNLSSKYSRKSFITSNYITFTFMTINNSRILRGLKIYLVFWNLLLSPVVQANLESSGPYTSLENSTNFNFCKFSKKIEYKTQVKFYKQNKNLKENRFIKKTNYRKIAIRMYIQNRHKLKIFLHTKKINKILIKKSF